MKRHKILKFPGGYRVKIKRHKRAYMQSYGNALALWGEDRKNGGTIRLDRTRSKKQRRMDLRHELGHVFTDWLEFFMDRVKL